MAWRGLLGRTVENGTRAHSGLRSAKFADLPALSSQAATTLRPFSEAAAAQQQHSTDTPGASSQNDARVSSSSAASSSGRPSAAEQEAFLRDAYRPSRFLQMQDHMLQREIMLKMGHIRKWQELPHIKSVTLTIDARNDTRISSDTTEKKNLMLHALAMEHITGRPASFITENQRSMHLASGVRSVLTGVHGLDMLEKLIYLILPNQTSFEGIPMARPVLPPPPRKVPKGKPQPEIPPPKTFAVDLRIDNILMFPDLEKNFELFEPVRSMQVTMTVDQAPSAEVASVYLAGFGLPLLSK